MERVDKRVDICKLANPTIRVNPQLEQRVANFDFNLSTSKKEQWLSCHGHLSGCIISMLAGSIPYQRPRREWRLLCTTTAM